MYSNNVSNFKGYYSGVGSRSTPLHVLYLMSKIAMIFEKSGYILRSGCAMGADAAFEDILVNPANSAEIYIPNSAFPSKMKTQNKSHYIIPKERYGTGMNGLYREAMHLIHSKKIHKGWKNCKPYVMDLHNRNMFQVLGLDFKTKSNFTICYTKGGEKKYEETKYGTGGTATAINASDLHDVEVFNLGNDKDYMRLYNFVEKHDKHIDYTMLHDMIVRSELNPQKLPYKDLFRILKDEEKARFPVLTTKTKLKHFFN
jgi:hypothetical protein